MVVVVCFSKRLSSIPKNTFELGPWSFIWKVIWNAGKSFGNNFVLLPFFFLEELVIFTAKANQIYRREGATERKVLGLLVHAQVSTRAGAEPI